MRHIQINIPEEVLISLRQTPDMLSRELCLLAASVNYGEGLDTGSSIWSGNLKNWYCILSNSHEIGLIVLQSASTSLLQLMLHQRAYYKFRSIFRSHLPIVKSDDSVRKGSEDLPMKYVPLGRTGLQVSLLALGCGGPSRLGLKQGKSFEEAQYLLHQALDLGINCIDTANDYGINPLIGQVINKVPRESVVVSCRIRLRNILKQRLTPQTLRTKIEVALLDLKTSYIDVCPIASVFPQDYQYVQEMLVPCLLQLKEAGKIRFIGITEKFHADTQHNMLNLALQDDCWDVMMTGFNLLNQSASRTIFPRTQARQIGVMAMYAVRKALRSETYLAKTLYKLHKAQQVSQDVTAQLIQDQLIGPEKASTLRDLAYRFCCSQPGVDVILCGTGNINHLRENVQSVLKPSLPEEDLALARKWFVNVSSVSGD